MSFPLVSIIMPLKNAEKWITETVLSIQDQSYEHWELLIINDQSEDSSIEIIEKMMQLDQRIQLIENSSSGIIPALQLGLKHSTGDFITRMDADDRMAENRLQIMVDALISSDSKSIVTGKVEYFSENEVSEGYLKYQDWLNDRIHFQDHFQHIYRECVVASPNWMARRNELLEDHVFTNLHYPEDYDMCFRWMQLGYTIKSISETTLLWREHPERTSRNSKIYDQQSFFELKVSWFMNNYPHISSVGIVGIGQKGKLLAQLFEKAKFHFQLYDLNASNMNQKIEGKTVQPTSTINDEILLIARYPKDLAVVQSYIENLGYRFGENAFWV